MTIHRNIMTRKSATCLTEFFILKCYTVYWLKTFDVHNTDFIVFRPETQNICLSYRNIFINWNATLYLLIAETRQVTHNSSRSMSSQAATLNSQTCSSEVRHGSVTAILSATLLPPAQSTELKHRPFDLGLQEKHEYILEDYILFIHTRQTVRSNFRTETQTIFDCRRNTSVQIGSIKFIYSQQTHGLWTLYT
jgi:hypothetical protein